MDAELQIPWVSHIKNKMSLLKFEGLQVYVDLLDSDNIGKQ